MRHRREHTYIAANGAIDNANTLCLSLLTDCSML